ncbi:unnamed protein product [Trichobilharzia szidati]|nr:unnamed protein product [Trichobilharzia szidati]
METESDMKSFHRMPSERRRKLWSLAARAAVKCPDDVEKEVIIHQEGSLTKGSGSLAKTQDSGVSVDFTSDNQPYSTTCSPYTSHSHCRISLDTSECGGNYEYGRLTKTSKQFHENQPGVTLSADLSDSAYNERGRSYVSKRKSVFSIPHIPSHLSSISTNIRRIRTASKQFDTSTKQGSADTSGLGSSLDWVSLEAGQLPFHRKMSTQYLSNPRDTVNVHCSLDEKQISHPLMMKKHLTSDDVDSEHQRQPYQESSMKTFSTLGNPREFEKGKVGVPSYQVRQKPIQPFKEHYYKQQLDFQTETAVSISAPCSPYRPSTDIPSRHVIRDPHIIAKSFDSAYTSATRRRPHQLSYSPTTHLGEPSDRGIPVGYYEPQDGGNEWPGITESDHTYLRYASDKDSISQAKMIPGITKHSMHRPPVYRRIQQQYLPTHLQGRKQKSLYKRSLTLGDNVEHMSTDWMEMKPKMYSSTQMYTVPPPTNEKEAYYNGLLMQQKYKDAYIDAKFKRFNQKYPHDVDDTCEESELQGLLQKPQDLHQFQSAMHSSSRRRWTSAEIPEVKITPVFVGLSGIQYEEENDDIDDDGDVYNYPKYSTGRKRPYEEEFLSHPLHPPPPPIAPFAPSAAAAHNKYLTPPYNKGDSFRRAVSLDKPSYPISSLYEQHQQPQIQQQQQQQYQRYQQRQQQQQYRQPQHLEESLESKFTRQYRFKYRLPYYSTSLDYPSSSSSKARPLLHPGYVQTYNIISPIEEKGDFELETKRYQKTEGKINQDIDDIIENKEKVYCVQTKEKDGFSRDSEKSIQPHPMTTDIKTDGSKHTADGSISNSSSISNHNINKHKFYETTDMHISKPFNASFDEIVPYDKSIPVTHKEVRISDTQPIVAISKKSINLSSNELNIQSKLLSTSHTTPPPTGSTVGGVGGVGGGGVLKVSVQLGENEIQEFAEYWDHSIFSRARVTAVCLAGVASVCLVCTVCASTWLYQGYAENITYSGFWKRCNYFNQTCEITLPFLTKHEGWQDGAFFILILAILLSFLGLSLSVAGHLVYALPKRLYYFHSGGEAHVVAAFVTALSVLIYHITIRLHLRTEGPVNFGEAYGISWFACFLHLLAAILLLLDEIINELVNLATRVHCIRSCLKCIIQTYSKTIQKKRQLLTHYNTKFTNGK